MRDFIKKIPTSSIVLTILAVLLAVWGGYQLTLSRGADVYRNAVKIENGQYLSENEGKYVCVSGKPVMSDDLEDALTGVKTDGFVLKRNVEMYQYYIESDTVQTDYFTYQRQNIQGDGGEEYNNPVFPEELQSVEIIGDVSLGGYKINQRYLYTLAGGTGFFGGTDFMTQMKGEFPEFENSFGLKPTKNGYSNGSAEPKVGDIRITYEYIPADRLNSLALFGVQKNGFIGTDSENDRCYMAYSVQDMEKEIDEAYGSYGSAANGMFIIMSVLLIAAVLIFFSKNRKLNGGGAV